MDSVHFLLDRAQPGGHSPIVTQLLHGKSRKNHGIWFWESIWNPDTNRW